MAFYYVKSGGTATGDGGRAVTARTGPWNATDSEYYDTLSDAVSATTAPTAGDVICWSDESSDTIGSSTTVTLPIGVSVVTVDNGAQQTRVTASTAQIDNAADNGYQIRSTSSATSKSIVDGAYIKTGGAGWGVSTFCLNTEHIEYHECILDQQQTNPNSLYVSEAHCSLIDCTTTGFDNVYPVAGGNLRIYGGTLTCRSNLGRLSVNGSGDIVICGCDLSASNTNLGYQSNNAEASGTMRVLESDLPAGWTTPNMTGNSQRSIVVQNCDNAYQYVKEDRSGTVDFVTNVYYDAHDTLDDGLNKGSYEIDTSGSCSKQLPCKLGGIHPEEWMSAINTEVATKKKVRIRFVPLSGDTLNDGDVSFLVLAPVTGSTYRSYAVHDRRSLLDSGSSLSTETTSGNWTGAGLASTAYYYDIDLGNPGNGRVVVEPRVSKANVTVYFSWQLEFVA